MVYEGCAFKLEMLVAEASEDMQRVYVLTDCQLPLEKDFIIPKII